MKEGSAPTNGPSAKTRTRTCRWKGETQNDENKRTCSFGADMAQKHIQTKLVGGLLERLLSAGEKGVTKEEAEALAQCEKLLKVHREALAQQVSAASSSSSSSSPLSLLSSSQASSSSSSPLSLSSSS
eukprot:1193338-Prorocentrum_minimum.AAC.1